MAPPTGNQGKLLNVLTLQWWADSRWPLIVRHWCLTGPENREKRCAKGKEASWLLAPSFLWCLTISSLASYHNHTGHSVRLGKSYPACSVHFTLLKLFSSSKDLHFKLMDNKNIQYIPPGLYRAHRLQGPSCSGPRAIKGCIFKDWSFAC